MTGVDLPYKPLNSSQLIFRTPSRGLTNHTLKTLELMTHRAKLHTVWGQSGNLHRPHSHVMGNITAHLDHMKTILYPNSIHIPEGCMSSIRHEGLFPLYRKRTICPYAETMDAILTPHRLRTHLTDKRCPPPQVHRRFRLRVNVLSAP